MHRLSSLDHLQPPFYTRAFFVWNVSHIQSIEQWETVAAHLESSLQAYVAKYLPLLTAEIVRVVAPPDRGALYVREPGTRLPLVRRASIDDWVPSSATLMSGATATWPLQRLDFSAADDEPLETGEEGTSLKVRLTWCRDASRAPPANADGAVVLVVHLRHEVGDGASIALLVEQWAEFAAKGDVAEPLVHEPSHMTGKRQPDITPPPGPWPPLPCATFLPWRIVAATLDANADRGVALHRFRFFKSAIDEMRADAERRHAMGSGEKYSANDVVVAHLWRKLIAAADPRRSLPPTTPLYASIPVSIRGRFDKVSARHFGNAFVYAPVELEASELLNQDVPVAARKVHASVSEARIPAGIHRLMDYEIGLEQREPGFFARSAEAVVFSSNVGPAFPWHSAELLGPSAGKPALATIIPSVVIPHTAFFLPPPPRSINSGAAIDVVVALPAQELKQLLEDPKFAAVYLGAM